MPQGFDMTMKRHTVYTHKLTGSRIMKLFVHPLSPLCLRLCELAQIKGPFVLLRYTLLQATGAVGMRLVANWDINRNCQAGLFG